MRRILIALLMIMLPAAGFAEVCDTDSVAPKRRNFVTRIIDYISKTNQPDTTKKLDISILGGPYYSSENKLGLGLIAAGLYRRNPRDSVISQLNLYGNASISGYYKFGIDGIQYLGRTSNRLIYDASFESNPDKFWGIGYSANCRNDNETSYKKWHARLDCSFLIRMPLNNLYIGPHLLIDYLIGHDIDDMTLWNNQCRHTFTNSVGFKVEYDTRDSRFNARKGIYVGIDQMFAPRFFGNKYAFSSTEINLNGYTGVWKGGVLAFCLSSRMTYGNTPWGLMSKIGGSYCMRGYWEGRYNDKCSAYATIELRQNIYRRHGVAVWAGIGEVYSKPHEIFRGHPLPNAGFGYRWEFKKDVNLRVDFGFGYRQYGIIFNINEAF